MLSRRQSPLKAYRLYAGYVTQADAQTALGCSVNPIGRAESGVALGPALAQKMAVLYGKGIAEIWAAFDKAKKARSKS